MVWDLLAEGATIGTPLFYQFQCNGMIGHSDSYGSEAGTGQIYSRVGVLLKRGKTKVSGPGQYFFAKAITRSSVWA